MYTFHTDTKTHYKNNDKVENTMKARLLGLCNFIGVLMIIIEGKDEPSLLICLKLWFVWIIAFIQAN